MTKSPIQQHLEELIDASPDKVVAVQLCFKPGMAMQAGALARGPVAGTFKLGVGARATKDTPGNFRPGETVICDIVFEADAVMQVLSFTSSSGLMTPDNMPLGSLA